MKQYTVTGMSCAACSARVEKAVSKVPGVTSCSVSLLTNSMGVDGDVSEQAVISAVEAAGYGAAPKGQGISEGAQNMYSSQEEALADHETPVLKRRLWWSVGFLAVLMYISMGHMIGLPTLKFLSAEHNPINYAVSLLILTIAFFWYGYDILKNAVNELMDVSIDETYENEIKKETSKSDVKTGRDRKIRKFAGKVLAAILTICLSITGIYDFAVIVKGNGPGRRVTVNMNSELTQWLEENLEKNDLLLTPEYSMNEVTMSGAMLYCGWPYYAWSAGYDTNYRAAQAVTIYTTSDSETLKKTVQQEKITYILFEEGSEFEQQECREETIAAAYEKVYETQDGRIRIYKTTE